MYIIDMFIVYSFPDSGYRYHTNENILQGSSQIVCGEDGGWKGDLPSCLPKPCGLPRTFPDMKVHNFFLHFQTI